MMLPRDLAFLHRVFDVAMLKKFVGGPASILPVDGLGVDENLNYEELQLNF